LQLWQVVTGATSGAIFGLSNSGIQQVIDALALRAGVTVTAHDFRRTFATHWIRHCHAPNSDLAERLLEVQLGHAPRTVTQRHYLVLSYEDVAAYYVSPFDDLDIPGITPRREGITVR
jgi:integrase